MRGAAEAAGQRGGTGGGVCVERGRSMEEPRGAGPAQAAGGCWGSGPGGRCGHARRGASHAGGEVAGGSAVPPLPAPHPVAGSPLPPGTR